MDFAQFLMKNLHSEVDHTSLMAADIVSRFLTKEGYVHRFESASYEGLPDIKGIMFPFCAATLWGIIELAAFHVAVERTIVTVWEIGAPIKLPIGPSLTVDLRDPESFDQIQKWLWARLPFIARPLVLRNKRLCREER